MKIKQILFYILSFTWGAIMTIPGCIVGLILIAAGCPCERFGWCFHIKVGKRWGGLELGVFFLTDNVSHYITCCHEHGHALQNIIFGPLMLPLISIPSACRYWIREFQSHRGKKLPPYDSIWFEGDATRRGKKFMEKLGRNRWGTVR